MELQESALRNVHLILGWPASPRYADLRGVLTEELLNLAGPESDWDWDGPMTLVIGEERGLDFALGPTELVIASESSSAELGDLPAQLASFVLEQLAIKQVSLVGAGVIWLAPVSTIEELNEWLADQLGVFGKPGLYDAFGGKPSSFALQSEITDDKFSYDIELKPMTSSDAAEADAFKSDEEDDFPPAALYIEIRRAKFGENAADAVPQAFDDNFKRVLTAGHKFDLAIRENL